MESLLLLFGVIALLWFWLHSLRTRELAVQAAQELCTRQGLQLLDSTVALSGLGLRRTVQGHVALLRTYQFEYSSDGDQRQRGFVLVLGSHVESAGLAAEM